MKINSLVNWTGASVLALSLAILPSIQPASAQTTTPMDPSTPGATTTETDRVAPGTGTTADDRDDGFDWGWLGLLGLIGLAGLKGKDRDTNTYSDRTTTTTNPSTNPRY